MNTLNQQFSDIKDGASVMFDDWGVLRQGFIIWASKENKYTVYLWHHNQKPRFKIISQEAISIVSQSNGHTLAKEMNNRSNTESVNELRERYAHIVRYIEENPLFNLVSTTRQDTIDRILWKINSIISHGRDLPLREIDGIALAFLENRANKETRKSIKNKINNSSITNAFSPRVRTKEVPSNIVDFPISSKVKIRGNGTDVVADTEIPTHLVPLFRWDFPIKFAASLSLSEINPVAWIIQKFVENPYDMEVLDLFRAKAYAAIYRGSWFAPESGNGFDYDNFVTLNHDIGLNLDECGIGWLHGYVSYFPESDTIINADLEDGYATDSGRRAEYTANIILKGLDRLIVRMKSNPTIIHSQEFRAQIDTEVWDILSAMFDGITTDKRNGTKKQSVGELSLRSGLLDSQDAPTPKHLLHSLWYTIQTSVRSVRLRDQRSYIDHEFGSRKVKYLEIVNTKRSGIYNNDEWWLELFTQIKEHYLSMLWFYDTVHKGGGEKTGRIINKQDLQTFRNNTFQFDVLMSCVYSEKPESSETLAIK